MNPLADVDVDTVLSGTGDWVDADLASALAHHPLASLETEFPHATGAMESPEDPERPSDLHPVFYGCFDWHSAVHSHWALIRQLRIFEDHPVEADVVESFDARFTGGNIQQEAEYLDANPSFEKPYGWAWLLHLAAELHLWDDDRAGRWAAALEPLEETVVDLVESEFLSQDRPFRVGTHGNSAFALHCVLDYARTTGNDPLASAAAETARDFYGDDRDYPVEYEPLGWDFLSPALTEADLMRRVYDREAFRSWLDGFLPDLMTAPYDSILEPVTVDDSGDGVALHLVGLNVSKAWYLAGLVDAFDDHRYAGALERSAGAHAEAGLDGAFTDDYAGAHWLSSFVLYFLTRNDGGIAVDAVA